MNDYLQSILHNEISELKKEFPMFDSSTDCTDTPNARHLFRGQLEPVLRPSESLSDALQASAATTQNLNVIQLEPISIKSAKKNPQIVNVKQTFRFPNNFITEKKSYHSYGQGRAPAPRNMHSQTSKTIVELYEAEKRDDELLVPRESSDSDVSLDRGLHRNTSYTVMDPVGKKNHHKNCGAVKPVDMIMIKPKVRAAAPSTPYFSGRKKRPGSKRKYTRDYFPMTSKSTPKRKLGMYGSLKVDGGDGDSGNLDDPTTTTTTMTTTESSNPSTDSLDDECSTFGTTVQIGRIIDKLQDNIWEVSLHGIRELMETASQVDWKKHEKYVTVINRKMIDFLKSPRSSLCRYACQASGELFREAKSVKRPEFDEIVDILLCKTADPNRFIQKDANVALDKLVTYIPIGHSVRVLAARGPVHKNPLVRTATARLLVCICALSGLDAILGTNASPRTRKEILTMLAKFLTDKNLETRKFGERLYKMLRKHKFFNEYFYKDMDSNCKNNLKRVLKGM
ncbi:uncharacterized protein LOC6037423 [Culex quinquefasciatus]|nr:uncharacterized protein LOC6037423 [Culex quinquefasciatus]